MKLNNKIHYKNLSDLSQQIKQNTNIYFSVSTISKILSDTILYKNHFKVNKERNILILLIDFRNIAEETHSGKSFVTLENHEIDFLLREKNSLLTKYFLYIKYYCSITKEKETDFTAEQFLQAVGYCTTSGSNKQKLCYYNQILENNGLIQIKRYTDNKGHSRNKYRVNRLVKTR